jgi:hypothetical protein
MEKFLANRTLSEEQQSEINGLIANGDLIMAASLCGLFMRQSDLREFIDEIFVKPHPKPHNIHNIIVDLGPDSFITTNYDHLVQDAYYSVHNGLSLFPVNNDQIAEQAQIVKSGSSRFIFTPHGSAEKCNTIILKKEDYRNIEFSLSYTLNTLQTLMISRPVVYIGFGLQDPDFLLVKDNIAATYHQAERDHFAIMPNVSDLQKSFWREKYGLNIISYEKKSITGNVSEDYSELLELLNSLHQTLRISTSADSPKEVYIKKVVSDFVTENKNSLIRYCESVINVFIHGSSPDLELTAKFRKDLSPQTDEKFKGDRTSFQFGKYIPVQKLLSSQGNHVLIGQPGTGKTRAVNKYASDLAKITLAKLQNNPKIKDCEMRHAIPVLLPMKEYDGDIKKMINSRLPRSIDVDAGLEKGFFVIIFDAVNETPRNLTESKVISNNITWLMGLFPNNRFIFTSRTINYVSFWKMPVFELQPLAYPILEDYLKEVCGILPQSLQLEMIELLSNPLFLALYGNMTPDERSAISNTTSLLINYFKQLEQRVSKKFDMHKVTLRSFLSTIAFEMVDSGIQTISKDEIFDKIKKVFGKKGPMRPEHFFNFLIAIDVFVPDAEGKIGFYHQSILEFLAASRLASLCKNNKGIIEEKLTFLRWDETILMAIGLLSGNKRELTLRNIAKKDLGFACRAFESATVKEREMGLYLFDEVVKRIFKHGTTPVEKNNLAESILHLQPYGRKEILMKLLDDANACEGASKFLANMNVKEAIPKIVKLLLKDNVWPSSFAVALELLADEAVVHDLITYGKKIKGDSLSQNNIGSVLKKFESDQLYVEISQLAKSPNVTDRTLAATILEDFDSDKAKALLAQLIFDPNEGVQWRAILGLRWAANNKPFRTKKLLRDMFSLLTDEKVGDLAADYLRELDDSFVLRKAKRLIADPSNHYELINSASVISKESPDQSKKVLFWALDNFKSCFHKCLSSALENLPIPYLVPDLFRYMKMNNSKLRLTCLDALGSAIGIDQEDVPIKKENCDYLLSLWENCHNNQEFVSLRNVLPHVGCCCSEARNLLLSKIGDPKYPFRKRLIEVVAGMRLKLGDLSPDTIEWLITELNQKSRYSLRDSYDPVAEILGTVCGEEVVVSKLVPLLHSENGTIRNNAVIAITIAERSIGKRFVIK